MDIKVLYNLFLHYMAEVAVIQGIVPLPKNVDDATLLLQSLDYDFHKWLEENRADLQAHGLIPSEPIPVNVTNTSGHIN